MTTIGKSDAATVELEGPFGARELRGLRSRGRIECLRLTKQPLVTVNLAKELSGLLSVRWLFLWCTTTRTSMRHVMSIPGLEELDVLEIRYPGKLGNFAEAAALKAFRCDHYMSENDLIEVSRLPNLEDLSAQNATLTTRALDSVLSIPKRRSLDIEATALDDKMAAVLASSSTIEVGGYARYREGTAKHLHHVSASVPRHLGARHSGRRLGIAQ